MKNKKVVLTKNEQRIVNNLLSHGKQMPGGLGISKAELIKQVTSITRKKQPPLTDKQKQIYFHYLSKHIELSYFQVVEFAAADAWLPESFRPHLNK